VVLSASIPALKSRAKKLQRAGHIPLCEALDQVAAEEGYATWSLLVAKEASQKNGADLLDRLDPGDLVLLGARPGHGKSLCAVRLLISTLRRGHPGWFFALQNDAPNIDAWFELLGERRSRFPTGFVFEHSDEVCAPDLLEKLAAAPERALVVIDHLQLLDQRRKAPELEQQVRSLRSLAKRRGCILVFLSQIRSAFDQRAERLPSRRDVRLLDALDLGLFDKFLFLRKGRAQLREYRP